MNKLELSKCVRIPSAETKEEFYLVDCTGSMGCIYDFSRTHVYTLEDINRIIEECNVTNPEIKYSDFDERIGFHKWNILADFDGYTSQHLMWVLSTSSEHPWLSQCTLGDLMV